MRAEVSTIPDVAPGPEITTPVAGLEHWSSTLKVRTPEEYKSAIEALRDVKNIRARVVEFFEPMKSAAHNTWKQILSRENSYVHRLDAAERQAKARLIDYQRQEEQKRLAEQRRLQAEADERARKEQERLAARAAKAEASGKIEKAELLMEEAAAVSAPVVQVSNPVPKVAGTSVRKIWKARVVDANLVTREFLVPDQKMLDAFAQATKGAKHLDGIEFYEEQVMAIGR